MITHGDDLLISGAWLLGIGTLVGAIGQTRQTLTSTDLGKDLVLKGNGIEAVGNSLQAIGRSKMLNPENERTETYFIFGSWLEAIGNIADAVGIGMQLSGSVEEGIRTDALGSGIQGLGAAIEAIGASLTEESISRSFEIKGNGLIAAGSFLESVGNIFILNEKVRMGEHILLLGSWTQVFGAFILIEAFSLGPEPEPEKGKDGHNRHYSYANYC
ncbi:DUF6944 family repetitive protein [Peribacillus frigoritolerans]|uniref:DUF6944 family repetitive protein n=1 Tax=Peribacillus frigoritolerans TaxID=450367 RepID=UPI0022308446|nr:hypothetical protein [Peribacillus frigoritolerans]MDM5312177.1 hypothetical protein [Peribacillus frigoritolerans]UZD46425.1 hypothetical protein OMJ04_23075 [Peribacillus frigoritolerans]